MIALFLSCTDFSSFVICQISQCKVFLWNNGKIKGQNGVKMDMTMNKPNDGNTTVIHYMKCWRVPALTHYFLFTWSRGLQTGSWATLNITKCCSFDIFRHSILLDICESHYALRYWHVLHSISEWCQNNLLVLNLHMTHIVKFTSSTFLTYPL